MRRLKHKHTRRAVKFLKINYGFREPFKVILDGNFVHALRETKRGEAREVLAKLLGAPVKTYVTRCALLELKALGAEFADTLGAARKAGLHLNCGHDDSPQSAAECLQSCVGERNTEHYFVATQDRGLRSALGLRPGGASVFVSVNGMHLEPPSDAQKAQSGQVEAAHMAVGRHELQAPALQGLAQAHQAAARVKSLFRRNMAKGPNPLAVKKKKRKQEPGAAAAAAEAAGSPAQPKRKRARRRRDDAAPGAPAVGADA